MTALRCLRPAGAALLALAILVLLSACARHVQKPTPAATSVAVDLSAYDNVRIITPLPSAPPLTRTQRALLKWQQRGWHEIASADGRMYLENKPGLQAVRASDNAVLWRNPHCTPVGATLSIIHGEIFTACAPSVLSVLNADTGRALQRAHVPMYAVSRAVAGDKWLAIQGWNDGAALTNALVILRRETLKPITQQLISDGTFLGVIGDRAYIDDWCCNGRADEYRPATIYSISLRDGTASEPVDLRPDPEQHPANLQPIGQGENNYMRGHYLFVPIGKTLYRYDILNLRAPPARTQNTPSTSSG